MDPSAATTPLGSANFGNAMQPQGPPVAPAMMLAAAGGGGDEDCEEGVFCAPRGPDEGCGKITFEAETQITRQPGNLLLVFDRSTSMLDAWQGQPRWQAAGGAIVAALEPLGSDLALAGAVFFPTGSGRPGPLEGCGVNATDPSHIDFTSGDEFIERFRTDALGAGAGLPYFPVLGGRTPLLAGLQQAQTVLASGMLEGVTAVVVITDGQPNCRWNAATANQIVTEWRTMLGISTHVIGLPGIGGLGPLGGPGGIGGLGGIGPGGGALDGTQVLNDLAEAGGTDQFITPADPAALQAKLQSIVSETVAMGFDNCNITLNPAAVVPDELLMIVEEPGVTEKRQVPRSYGWQLNPASDQVAITGQLCDEAMTGRFTSITFEYACPEAPPPDPIPPLM